MDFQVDPKHMEAFAGLTGSRWPEADEEALRRLAPEYRALAEIFRGMQHEMESFVAQVQQGYAGEAANSFAEYAKQFITGNPKAGGKNSMEMAAESADAMGDFVWKTAADVEYQKMQAIGQLVLMFVEIAIAIAMIIPSFGASLLKIPAIKLTTAWFLKLALKLVMATIISLAMELIFAAALDAAIQDEQIRRGVRDVRNPELTDAAMKSAAVSGALGGLAWMGAEVLGGMVAKGLSKLFGDKLAFAGAKTLGNKLQTYSQHLGSATRGIFGDGAEGGAKGLGKGVAGPETAGNSFGKALGDATSNFSTYFRTGFGSEWARTMKGFGPGSMKSLTTSPAMKFASQVETAFGKHFGSQLGEEAAKNAGRNFSDTLTRNVRQVSPDVLQDKLAKSLGDDFANKVGKDTFDKLTKDYPKALDFKESGLHAGVKAFGGAPVWGLHGYVSEGMSNMFFGPEHEWKADWYSFTGGMAGGVFEQLGEHYISDPISEHMTESLNNLYTKLFGGDGGVGQFPDLSETQPLLGDQSDTSSVHSVQTSVDGDIPGGDGSWNADKDSLSDSSSLNDYSQLYSDSDTESITSSTPLLTGNPTESGDFDLDVPDMPDPFDGQPSPDGQQTQTGPLVTHASPSVATPTPVSTSSGNVTAGSNPGTPPPSGPPQGSNQIRGENSSPQDNGPIREPNPVTTDSQPQPNSSVPSEQTNQPVQEAPPNPTPVQTTSDFSGNEQHVPEQPTATQQLESQHHDPDQNQNPPQEPEKNLTERLNVSPEILDKLSKQPGFDPVMLASYADSNDLSPDSRWALTHYGPENALTSADAVQSFADAEQNGTLFTPEALKNLIDQDKPVIKPDPLDDNGWLTYDEDVAKVADEARNHPQVIALHSQIEQLTANGADQKTINQAKAKLWQAQRRVLRRLGVRDRIPVALLSDLSATTRDTTWKYENNPLKPEDWAPLRNQVPVTKVRTSHHTFSRDSGGHIDLSAKKRVNGPVSFDWRRMKVGNRYVQEYTHIVHLDLSTTPNKVNRQDAEKTVVQAVNQLYNLDGQGRSHRTITGDQLHVRVEFTDNAKLAHSQVKLDDSRTDQKRWTAGDLRTGRRPAHEIGHYLGLVDEYSNRPGQPGLLFNQAPLENSLSSGARGRVHLDRSLMGSAPSNPFSEVKARHLVQMERIARDAGAFQGHPGSPLPDSDSGRPTQKNTQPSPFERLSDIPGLRRFFRDQHSRNQHHDQGHELQPFDRSSFELPRMEELWFAEQGLQHDVGLSQKEGTPLGDDDPLPSGLKRGGAISSQAQLLVSEGIWDGHNSKPDPQSGYRFTQQILSVMGWNPDAAEGHALRDALDAVIKSKGESGLLQELVNGRTFRIPNPDGRGFGDLTVQLSAGSFHKLSHLSENELNSPALAKQGPKQESSPKTLESRTFGRRTPSNLVAGALLTAIQAPLSAVNGLVRVFANVGAERTTTAGSKYHKSSSEHPLKLGKLKHAYSVDFTLDYQFHNASGGLDREGTVSLGRPVHLAYPDAQVDAGTGGPVRRGANAVELPPAMFHLVAGVSNYSMGPLNQHVAKAVPGQVKGSALDTDLLQLSNQQMLEEESLEGLVQGITYGPSRTDPGSRRHWFSLSNPEPAKLNVHVKSMLRGYRKIGGERHDVGTTDTFRTHQEIAWQNEVGSSADLKVSARFLLDVGDAGWDSDTPVKVGPLVEGGAGSSSADSVGFGQTGKTKSKSSENEGVQVYRLDLEQHARLDYSPERSKHVQKTSVDPTNAAVEVTVRLEDVSAFEDALNNALGLQSDDSASPAANQPTAPPAHLVDVVDGASQMVQRRRLPGAEDLAVQARAEIRNRLKSVGVDPDSPKVDWLDVEKQLRDLNPPKLLNNLDDITLGGSHKVRVDVGSRWYEFKVTGTLGDVTGDSHVRLKNPVSFSDTRGGGWSWNAKNSGTFSWGGSISGYARVALGGGREESRTFFGGVIDIVKGKRQKGMSGALSSGGEDGTRQKFTGAADQFQRDLRLTVEVSEGRGHRGFKERMREAFLFPPDPLAAPAPRNRLTVEAHVEYRLPRFLAEIRDGAVGKWHPGDLVSRQVFEEGRNPDGSRRELGDAVDMRHAKVLALPGKTIDENRPGADVPAPRGKSLLETVQSWSRIKTAVKASLSSSGRAGTQAPRPEGPQPLVSVLNEYSQQVQGHAADATKRFGGPTTHRMKLDPDFYRSRVAQFFDSMQVLDDGGRNGWTYDRMQRLGIEMSVHNERAFNTVKTMQVDRYVSNDMSVSGQHSKNWGIETGAKALFGMGQAGLGFGEQGATGDKQTLSGADKQTLMTHDVDARLYRGDLVIKLRADAAQKLFGQMNVHWEFSPYRRGVQTDVVELVVPDGVLYLKPDGVHGERPSERHVVEQLPESTPLLRDLGKGPQREVQVSDFEITPPEQQEQSGDEPWKPIKLSEHAAQALARAEQAKSESSWLGKAKSKLFPKWDQTTNPPLVDARLVLSELDTKSGMQELLTRGFVRHFNRSPWFGTSHYEFRAMVRTTGHGDVLGDRPAPDLGRGRRASKEANTAKGRETSTTRKTKFTAGVVVSRAADANSDAETENSYTTSRPGFTQVMPSGSYGYERSWGTSQSNEDGAYAQQRTNIDGLSDVLVPVEVEFSVVKVKTPPLLLSTIFNGAPHPGKWFGQQTYWNPDQRNLEIPDGSQRVNGRLTLTVPTFKLHQQYAEHPRIASDLYSRDWQANAELLTAAARAAESFQVSKEFFPSRPWPGQPGSEQALLNDIVGKIAESRGRAGHDDLVEPGRVKRAFGQGTLHRERLRAMLSAFVQKASQQEISGANGHQDPHGVTEEFKITERSRAITYRVRIERLIGDVERLGAWQPESYQHKQGETAGAGQSAPKDSSHALTIGADVWSNPGYTGIETGLATSKGNQSGSSLTTQRERVTSAVGGDWSEYIANSAYLVRIESKRWGTGGWTGTGESHLVPGPTQVFDIRDADAHLIDPSRVSHPDFRMNGDDQRRYEMLFGPDANQDVVTGERVTNDWRLRTLNTRLRNGSASMVGVMSTDGRLTGIAARAASGEQAGPSGFVWHWYENGSGRLEHTTPYEVAPNGTLRLPDPHDLGQARPLPTITEESEQGPDTSEVPVEQHSPDEEEGFTQPAPKEDFKALAGLLRQPFKREDSFTSFGDPAQSETSSATEDATGPDSYELPELSFEQFDASFLELGHPGALHPSEGTELTDTDLRPIELQDENTIASSARLLPSEGIWDGGNRPQANGSYRITELILDRMGWNPRGAAGRALRQELDSIVKFKGETGLLNALTNSQVFLVPNQVGKGFSNVRLELTVSDIRKLAEVGKSELKEIPAQRFKQESTPRKTRAAAGSRRGPASFGAGFLQPAAMAATGAMLNVLTALSIGVGAPRKDETAQRSHKSNAEHITKHGSQEHAFSVDFNLHWTVSRPHAANPDSSGPERHEVALGKPVRLKYAAAALQTEQGGTGHLLPADGRSVPMPRPVFHLIAGIDTWRLGALQKNVMAALPGDVPASMRAELSYALNQKLLEEESVEGLTGIDVERRFTDPGSRHRWRSLFNHNPAKVGVHTGIELTGVERAGAEREIPTTDTFRMFRDTQRQREFGTSAELKLRARILTPGPDTAFGSKLQAGAQGELDFGTSDTTALAHSESAGFKSKAGDRDGIALYKMNVLIKSTVEYRPERSKNVHNARAEDTRAVVYVEVRRKDIPAFEAMMREALSTGEDTSQSHSTPDVSTTQRPEQTPDERDLLDTVDGAAGYVQRRRAPGAEELYAVAREELRKRLLNAGIRLDPPTPDADPQTDENAKPLVDLDLADRVKVEQQLRELNPSKVLDNLDSIAHGRPYEVRVEVGSHWFEFRISGEQGGIVPGTHVHLTNDALFSETRTSGWSASAKGTSTYGFGASLAAYLRTALGASGQASRSHIGAIAGVQGKKNWGRTTEVSNSGDSANRQKFSAPADEFKRDLRLTVDVSQGRSGRSLNEVLRDSFLRPPENVFEPENRLGVSAQVEYRLPRFLAGIRQGENKWQPGDLAVKDDTTDLGAPVDMRKANVVALPGNVVPGRRATADELASGWNRNWRGVQRGWQAFKDSFKHPEDLAEARRDDPPNAPLPPRRPLVSELDGHAQDVQGRAANATKRGGGPTKHRVELDPGWFRANLTAFFDSTRLYDGGAHRGGMFDRAQRPGIAMRVHNETYRGPGPKAQLDTINSTETSVANQRRQGWGMDLAFPQFLHGAGVLGFGLGYRESGAAKDSLSGSGKRTSSLTTPTGLYEGDLVIELRADAWQEFLGQQNVHWTFPAYRMGVHSDTVELLIPKGVLYTKPTPHGVDENGHPVAPGPTGQELETGHPLVRDLGNGTHRDVHVSAFDLREDGDFADRPPKLSELAARAVSTAERAPSENGPFGKAKSKLFPGWDHRAAKPPLVDELRVLEQLDTRQGLQELANGGFVRRLGRSPWFGMSHYEFRAEIHSTGNGEVLGGDGTPGHGRKGGTEQRTGQSAESSTTRRTKVVMGASLTPVIAPDQSGTTLITPGPTVGHERSLAAVSQSNELGSFVQDRTIIDGRVDVRVPAEVRFSVVKVKRPPLLLSKIFNGASYPGKLFGQATYWNPGQRNLHVDEEFRLARGSITLDAPTAHLTEEYGTSTEPAHEVGSPQWQQAADAVTEAAHRSESFQVVKEFYPDRSPDPARRTEQAVLDGITEVIARSRGETGRHVLVEPGRVRRAFGPGTLFRQQLRALVSKFVQAGNEHGTLDAGKLTEPFRINDRTRAITYAVGVRRLLSDPVPVGGTVKSSSYQQKQALSRTGATAYTTDTSTETNLSSTTVANLGTPADSTGVAAGDGTTTASSLNMKYERESKTHNDGWQRFVCNSSYLVTVESKKSWFWKTKWTASGQVHRVPGPTVLFDVKNSEAHLFDPASSAGPEFGTAEGDTDQRSHELLVGDEAVVPSQHEQWEPSLPTILEEEPTAEPSTPPAVGQTASGNDEGATQPAPPENDVSDLENDPWLAALIGDLPAGPEQTDTVLSAQPDTGTGGDPDETTNAHPEDEFVLALSAQTDDSPARQGLEAPDEEATEAFPPGARTGGFGGNGRPNDPNRPVQSIPGVTIAAHHVVQYELLEKFYGDPGIMAQFVPERGAVSLLQLQNLKLIGRVDRLDLGRLDPPADLSRAGSALDLLNEPGLPEATRSQLREALGKVALAKRNPLDPDVNDIARGFFAWTPANLFQGPTPEKRDWDPDWDTSKGGRDAADIDAGHFLDPIQFETLKNLRAEIQKLLDEVKTGDLREGENYSRVKGLFKKLATEYNTVTPFDRSRWSLTDDGRWHPAGRSPKPPVSDLDAKAEQKKKAAKQHQKQALAGKPGGFGTPLPEKASTELPHPARSLESFGSKQEADDFLKQRFPVVTEVNREVRERTPRERKPAMTNCVVASLQLANSLQQGKLFKAFDTEPVSGLNLIENAVGGKFAGPFYDKAPVTNYLRSPGASRMALVTRRDGIEGHATLAFLDENGVVNYVDPQAGTFSSVPPVDRNVVPESRLQRDGMGIRFLPLPTGKVLGTDFTSRSGAASGGFGGDRDTTNPNAPTQTVSGMDLAAHHVIQYKLLLEFKDKPGIIAQFVPSREEISLLQLDNLKLIPEFDKLDLGPVTAPEPDERGRPGSAAELVKNPGLPEATRVHIENAIQTIEAAKKNPKSGDGKGMEIAQDFFLWMPANLFPGPQPNTRDWDPDMQDERGRDSADIDARFFLDAEQFRLLKELRAEITRTPEDGRSENRIRELFAKLAAEYNKVTPFDPDKWVRTEDGRWHPKQRPALPGLDGYQQRKKLKNQRKDELLKQARTAKQERLEQDRQRKQQEQHERQTRAEQEQREKERREHKQQRKRWANRGFGSPAHETPVFAGIPADSVRSLESFGSVRESGGFLRQRFPMVAEVNREVRDKRAAQGQPVGKNCVESALQLANSLRHGRLFKAGDTGPVSGLDVIEKPVGRKFDGPFYDAGPVVRYLQSPDAERMALVARRDGPEGHVTLAFMDDSGVVNFVDPQAGTFSSLPSVNPSIPLRDLFDDDMGIRFVPLPSGKVLGTGAMESQVTTGFGSTNPARTVGWSVDQGGQGKLNLSHYLHGAQHKFVFDGGIEEQFDVDTHWTNNQDPGRRAGFARGAQSIKLPGRLFDRSLPDVLWSRIRSREISPDHSLLDGIPDIVVGLPEKASWRPDQIDSSLALTTSIDPTDVDQRRLVACLVGLRGSVAVREAVMETLNMRKVEVRLGKGPAQRTETLDLDWDSMLRNIRLKVLDELNSHHEPGFSSGRRPGRVPPSHHDVGPRMTREFLPGCAKEDPGLRRLFELDLVDSSGRSGSYFRSDSALAKFVTSGAEKKLTSAWNHLRFLAWVEWRFLHEMLNDGDAGDVLEDPGAFAARRMAD